MLTEGHAPQIRGSSAIVVALITLVVASVLVMSHSDRAVGVETQAQTIRIDAPIVDTLSALPSVRSHRALSWVNGLASGLILPTDVTGRLEQQNPELAHVVVETWWALYGIPDER